MERLRRRNPDIGQWRVLLPDRHDKRILQHGREPECRPLCIQQHAFYDEKQRKDKSNESANSKFTARPARSGALERSHAARTPQGIIPFCIASSWGDPEQTFENQEFWQIFDICMNNLSETNARVFSMREFLGLEAHEICKELGISTFNCWVILHHARMSLRLCLQQRWFEREQAK